MIKSRMIRDVNGKQTPVIFLGIEEGNIERLKAGKQILVNLEELGFIGEIVIAYGKTKEDIINDLKMAGLTRGPQGGA